MPESKEANVLDALESAKEQYERYVTLTRVTATEALTTAKDDPEDTGYGHPLTLTVVTPERDSG